MSETENVLSEWFDGLDPDEIARCAEIIRAAVEMDRAHERSRSGEL